MGSEPPLAEMLLIADIAASTCPLLDRARGLVDTLDRWLPADAIWLTLADPGSEVYSTIGSTGLDGGVLDYLDRPSVAQEIRDADIDRDRPPVSASELPFALDDLPTWSECLVPAGFHEGLGVPLVEPGGSYVGMLTLLFASGEPVPADVRDQLAHVAPVIARGVSPMRSLLDSARMVQGATAGAVLLRNGRTFALPGLADDDPALAFDSPLPDLARQTLLSGRVYRSFLWPSREEHARGSHTRVTVLAATDLPHSVLGMLLLTPHADCLGLTSRELGVLGLIVGGRSNQQIARRLAISERTVATHVEHILHKLEVPTRTQAAVQAEREGCYVPSVRGPRTPSPSPSSPASSPASSRASSRAASRASSPAASRASSSRLRRSSSRLE